jgi:hypothetical protein
MIDVDFIEIGTSDFETLIESATDLDVGICVEPLSYYLEKLPNKKLVTKINCAISFDDLENDIDIYYIPVDTLKAHNLHLGLRGCNRIGEYHPHHIRYRLTHLVQIEKVKQIPISKLLIDNNIRKIKHLKLDTEGGDCFILKNLISYLKDKDKTFYPQQITFETNMLTNLNLIKETVDLYINYGYEIVSKNIWGEEGNTVLVLT